MATPKITDTPPHDITQELKQLRAELDQEIPSKALDRNILIATWNIRAFGGLTEKWKSASTDSPKRDLHALLCIAEIVSRFDVIAIQEAKSNLKALRHLMKALGRDWGLILTDVTKGSPGNSERMAYIFDTRKVKPSGLACELVIPKEQLDEISSDALEKQFARTPYAVSFRAGDQTFILITLHTLYGSSSTSRIPELRAIARWLSDWAKQTHSWGQNLIALGDFNIDRKGDKLYEAFTSSELTPPEDLNTVPRSIFSDPDKPADTEKFYDQIAWFTGANGTPALTLNYIRGGGFDFTRTALKIRGLTKTQLSWRISDHNPLWAEFSARK